MLVCFYLLFSVFAAKILVTEGNFDLDLTGKKLSDVVHYFKYINTSLSSISPIESAARLSFEGTKSLCNVNYFCPNPWPKASCSPITVYLAATNSSKNDEMVVTWLTRQAPVGTPIVQFGKSPGVLDQEAEGFSQVFCTPCILILSLTELCECVNRVTLKGLDPGQKYYYKVGMKGHPDSEKCWSTERSFYTLTDGTIATEKPTVFLVVGDIGLLPDTKGTLTCLKNDSHNCVDQESDQCFRGVLVLGDLAYNLNNGGGQAGDKLMMQWEFLAARMPFMTAPGNHELFDLFEQYKYRYSMPVAPGATNLLFYSWYTAGALVISLNTELAFVDQVIVIEQLKLQQAWLEETLKEGNKKRTADRPWIIVMGHRPTVGCTDSLCDTKTINLDNPCCFFNQLAHLFRKYCVDLVLTGHEHYYQRYKSCYHKNPERDCESGCRGATAEPQIIKNPSEPINIVEGDAGQCEGLDTVSDPLPTAVACGRGRDTGYGRLSITKTSLCYEHVSVGLGCKVFDSFCIIKTEVKKCGSKV